MSSFPWKGGIGVLVLTDNCFAYLSYPVKQWSVLPPDQTADKHPGHWWHLGERSESADFEDCSHRYVSQSHSFCASLARKERWPGTGDEMWRILHFAHNKWQTRTRKIKINNFWKMRHIVMPLVLTNSVKPFPTIIPALSLPIRECKSSYINQCITRSLVIRTRSYAARNSGLFIGN